MLGGVPEKEEGKDALLPSAILRRTQQGLVELPRLISLVKLLLTVYQAQRKPGMKLCLGIIREPRDNSNQSTRGLLVLKKLQYSSFTGKIPLGVLSFCVTTSSLSWSGRAPLLRGDWIITKSSNLPGGGGATPVLIIQNHSWNFGRKRKGSILGINF